MTERKKSEGLIESPVIDRILFYNYDPGADSAGLPDSVRNSVEPAFIDDSKDILLDRCREAFEAAVDASLQRTGIDRNHLIPLSSGLDSRAILAALINHPDVDSDQVTTVTYGMPGTWDYDIAPHIAHAAGVENIQINLSESSFQYSEMALRDYAATREYPGHFFDGYTNHHTTTTTADGHAVWSGFMGEATAGSHLPNTLSDDWEQACRRFAESNGLASVASPEFDPIGCLPTEPYVSPDLLGFDDQLDFAHRQQCFIAFVVLHNGIEQCTPFMDPHWLSFILNTPTEYRHDRSLFRKAMAKAYPDLFRIGTDSRHGLPPTASEWREWVTSNGQRVVRKFKTTLGLNYVPKTLNYIDFDKALRADTALRWTVQTLISDFEERDVGNWLNTEDIWEKHQRGESRWSELRAIASTELYLSSR